MKLHVISGLPRTASTLLAAIFNQNPEFRASIRTPVLDCLLPIKNVASGHFSTVFSEEKQLQMMRDIVESYHDFDGVTFENNRGWMLEIPLLKKLYPDAKVILCVRDVPSILNSFERQYLRNPLRESKIYPAGSTANVFTRTEALISGTAGVVSAPYSGLMQAMASPFFKDVFLVEHDTLTKNPEITLNKIYQFLDIPPFAHDFNNVVMEDESVEMYDSYMNAPGLHTVRKKVEYRQPEWVIPAWFLQNIHKNNPEFWRAQQEPKIEAPNRKARRAKAK